MQSSENLISSARKSFERNLTKDVKNREKPLKRFREFLQENEPKLVEAISKDVRKDPEETRMEIIIAVNHVTYLLNNLKRWTKIEKIRKRIVDLFNNSCVIDEPFGLVLVMTSWNLPVLSLLPVAGAIAAGNCVVIKPSHNSPNLGKFLSRKLPKYLDENCYPVVLLGNIPETCKLLNESKFDYIYYTGSPNLGRLVHKAANRFLTPTTLELGGKNPVYLDNTIDLKSATRQIIYGKFTTSGQSCIAPDYVMCTKEVENRFISYFKKILIESYGSNFYCSIGNELHFRRLCRLLQGLKIAFGGRANQADFSIEPTIAIDLDPAHPVMNEEIFGPILPIITVNNPRECIDFINKKEKPLTIYIFSNNKKTQNFIVENTSSGMVAIIDTTTRLIVGDLCFSGENDWSFYTFIRKKSVLFKSTKRFMEKLSYPLKEKKSLIVRRLLQSRKIKLDSIYFKYLFVFTAGFIVSYVIFQLIK